MRLEDYYRQVLVPGNVAVSALRRAGIPVDVARIKATILGWERDLADLERMVEGEAAERGFHSFKYSPLHSMAAVNMGKFLYSPQGLGLEVCKWTAPSKTFPNGQPSTDDDALSNYASIKVPRDDDHPIVRAVLKIRSLAKAKGTYADNFLATVRADGCCHPKFNWTLRTARLSAEDPPVHQIPERSDKAVADAIKSFIIPRLSPAPSVEEWDPRVHGSVFRWDIDGAEACIRAAMLTALRCSAPDPAWEYMRLGKDIHAHTASLIYQVPEGTYKKGSYERDGIAKHSFFASQYGAKWRTMRDQIWDKGRVWLPDDLAKDMKARIDAGHPGLVELYERDKQQLGEFGYCEDGYGRRRWVGVPHGVYYAGQGSDGKSKWRFATTARDAQDHLQGQLEHAFHIVANSPTQSMSASDAIWMLALCKHGEYVDLRVPPMWEAGGIPFPEAKGWQLHEGPGPGGTPLRAWHINTVHDSGWGDAAPGRHLEAAAKVIWRRCRAVPFDWRLKADVPYRVSLSVGPDMGHVESYNKVAARFGFDLLPER